MIGRTHSLPISKKINRLFLSGKFNVYSLASLGKNVAYDCANNTNRIAAKNANYYDIVGDWSAFWKGKRWISTHRRELSSCCVQPLFEFPYITRVRFSANRLMCGQ